ncbi:MAG: archaellin/type IV pilin N-terminal domain-containing protein [Thermofilaceae archaeon]
MARRKAISPVIATVIIVAVTIAVAIAVAFWMTGIIGLFTGVERLEIVSIDVAPQNNAWQITVRVRNTGTTPVTIDGLYINGQLVAQLQQGQWAIQQGVCAALTQINGPTTAIRPGVDDTLILQLAQGQQCAGATLNPGISIEVKLHSSGGKEYPKLVVLP